MVVGRGEVSTWWDRDTEVGLHDVCCETSTGILSWLLGRSRGSPETITLSVERKESFALGYLLVGCRDKSDEVRARVGGSADGWDERPSRVERL